MSLLGDIINSISNISNPFGAPAAATWNLQRCIFQQLNKGNVQKSTVLFFEKRGAAAAGGQIAENIQSLTAMDTLNDTGGRRLAVYEYPYRDGQEVSDLGRKGETFTLNIKFWGNQYQVRFNDFIANVANYSGDAQIIHPVRGVFPVKFHNWDYIHKFDEWNAVTIKAVFVEDNSVQLQTLNGTTQGASKSVSIDQSIRNGLSKLTSFQSAIQSAISDVTAILLLPKAIENSLRQRLSSITNAIADFQAQLAATFGSNNSTNTVNAQAAQAGVSVLNLNAGVASGISQNSQLPPVFQVGFDPATAAIIQSQITSFTDANQITESQAVFKANAIRASVGDAIKEIESTMGVYSFNASFNYRQMAVMVQDITESCISSATTQVISFKTQVPMSLRQIAFANGLDPDRQNDIVALNPTLPSINRVEANVTILVPAS